MYINIVKIIGLGLILSPLAMANSFELSEKSLIELAKKNNPNLSNIEISARQSKVNAEEFKDQFGFEAYAGLNHESTKSKALIPAQPVFGSINQYQVGLKKYTRYGAVLDLSATVDSRSSDSGATSYKDLTSTTYQLALNIDLWKDFMGRLSNTQFKNLKDLQEKDELQEAISKKVFETNIRKLYWRFIANGQKMEITNKLLRTSIKQAKNASKRRASSIGDKAEVARFESLVHQRKGQQISLEYEKELLLQSLRENFPELLDKDLKMAKLNFQKSVNEILQCTMKISSESKVPYETTNYDEIVSLLKKVQKRQYKLDNTYDDIDVKLNLGVHKKGVGSELEDGAYIGSYDKSLEDMADNDRSGFSAGLMVSIPFGEDKKSTVKAKELLSEAKFTSQLARMSASLNANFIQTKKSMGLLTRVIQEQKENSRKLKIRVTEMQKKYRQARIPEYVLIQDQDSLLQSDLLVIETQLIIVNTLLDYFSVFNNYNCAFNRI